jgi:pimeloyl-ACP methyl ester carboxylesterase
MRLSHAERRLSVSESLAISVAAAALLLGTMATANYMLGRRAERRHPPRGRFVEADGVRLHFLEHGTGQPVVLLHGNGAMAEDFEISGVFDRLAAQHRVIAFDRPGFGHSDRPRDRVWSASEQATLIRRALHQLDIRNPIILGHSWGTMVALEMALGEPQDTRGLVLISGYYIPTARTDVPLMAGPAIPVIGDLIRYTVSPLLGWLLAPMLFRKLFAPALVTDEFRLSFPVGMALRPWQIRASAADTALMVPGAARLAERYSDLNVPAIILGATGDKIVDTERQACGLHRKLRHNQLWLVGGTGHMLHHTNPEEVVAAVAGLAALVGVANAVQ